MLYQIKFLVFGIVLIAFLLVLGLVGILFNASNKSINSYYFDTQWDIFAYAHFFGVTKSVGNYKIVFQTFPFVPFSGENSTLNFSILDKDNSNINNVYAAFIIKEKDTTKIISQIPYKFYEFSDITIPYRFQNNTNYTTTLEAKIPGDPKYEAKPLVVDFDFAVGSSPISFDKEVLYYVTPSVIAITAGIVIYFKSKKRRRRRI